MLRKLSETFTATHLTAIIIAGIVAPTVLYATVTYTPVAITDPNTGVMTYVDSERSVWTYNPIQGYTNNPGYTVNIQYTTPSDNSHATIYTVPSGKVLIAKAFQWNFHGNVTGIDAWMYIEYASAAFANGYDSDQADGSEHTTFDSGIVFSAGPIEAEWGSVSGSTTHFVELQGYLVPAGAAPADAAAQLVSGGAKNFTRGKAH